MVSNRVMNIQPSQTVELTSRVAKLRQQGRKIISFNVGEPDFATPEHICKAAEEAMESGFTKYTPVMGIMELRQAICEKLQKDNGLSYTVDEITIGAGAKQCICTALQAVCNPGDEIIIPYPCWVSYTEMVRIAEGKPILVPCRQDFSLDIEAIRGAVTDKTKGILINTPNNPTGAVYSRESLMELADIAAEHEIYILSDEVYEKLIYDGNEHVSTASVSENAKNWTILINGFSKAYAMTGWRLGYVAADREVIRGMNVLQSQTVSSINSLAQKAGVEALNGTQEPVRDMCREFENRRDYMWERLCSMEGIACKKGGGAFYLMPDIRSYIGSRFGNTVIDSDFKMAEYLLEEAQIAVVPGSAFFAPGHLRFAYTDSMEKIKEGMDNMENALGRLTF